MEMSRNKCDGWLVERWHGLDGNLPYGYRWPSLTSLILDTKKGGIVSVAIVRLVKSTRNGPANLEANLFESTRRGKSMAESQTFSPTCNGGTESAVGWPMQCSLFGQVGRSEAGTHSHTGKETGYEQMVSELCAFLTQIMRWAHNDW